MNIKLVKNRVYLINHISAGIWVIWFVMKLYPETMGVGLAIPMPPIPGMEGIPIPGSPIFLFA